jgi:phage gpG-like protein
MITATVVGGTELIARLQAMPGGVRDGLARALKRLQLDFIREVVSGKLSGQVLRRRTGSLASSINPGGGVTRFEETDTSLTAFIGTNIKYAHVHEYGFQGTVTVRAHLRRITQVFGRPVTATQNVGSYTRRMNLPERSFLRSTLREMEPRIRSEMEQAVRAVLEK